MTDSAKHEVPDAAVVAAEQAEAEPATTPDGASVAEPDGDGAGPAKPDIDEVKRKFREALDRKREIHAEGQGKGGRDSGKIQGAHGPAASRRSFRRKSG
jgi:Family of unknown function (DUF5302)